MELNNETIYGVSDLDYQILIKDILYVDKLNLDLWILTANRDKYVNLFRKSHISLGIYDFYKSVVFECDKKIDSLELKIKHRKKYGITRQR